MGIGNNINNCGFLFDLDGVLVDTESIYTKTWENIDKIYPTGIENFPMVIKGNNLEKILTTYFPDKQIQAEICKIIDYEEVHMQYVLFAGVKELLEKLKKNNIPMAIVTSSSMAKVNRLFNQLPEIRQYFDAIITGDMVTHSKPHPECYLTAASLIARDIQDCYVVEDSISGIKSGLAAGAHVISLATTLPREQISLPGTMAFNQISDLVRENII